MKRNTSQRNETAGWLGTGPGDAAFFLDAAPIHKIDGATPWGGREKI
jgi:hypothetical protein